MYIDRFTFWIIYHWACYWISSQVVNVVVVVPVQLFVTVSCFKLLKTKLKLHDKNIQVVRRQEHNVLLLQRMLCTKMSLFVARSIRNTSLNFVDKMQSFYN